MMRGRFSQEDEAFVAANYWRAPAREIAERLGRPVWAIYRLAERLGLKCSPRLRNPEREATLRKRHAQGYTDAEIAAEIGMVRESVGDWRRALGLPSNASSAHRRATVAARTREQCAAAGVANLGALRAKVWRAKAVKAGWPEGLPLRAAQILTLLWENGPMTRRQIVEHLRPDLAGKLTRVVINRALLDNDAYNGHRHPNSYLATLMRRGLIVSLGRVVQMGGQSKNVCLYSLPLTLERGPVTAATATAEPLISANGPNRTAEE